MAASWLDSLAPPGSEDPAAGWLDSLAPLDAEDAPAGEAAAARGAAPGGALPGGAPPSGAAPGGAAPGAAPGAGRPPALGAGAGADGPAAPAHSEEAAWLEDMGFDAAAVQLALARSAGDADEALLSLRDDVAAAPGGGAGAKRRRLESPAAARQPSSPIGPGVIEVEGFECRVRDGRLRLWLPQVELDGPEVGRVRPDGSVLFRGVDDWTEELFRAGRPRTMPDALQGFDSVAAARALEEGAPWTWSDFASAQEVRSAHAELEALGASGVLSASGARTTAAQKGRTDRVAFLDLRGGAPACPPHCLALLRRLEAAAAALAWPPGSQLLCPSLGMAAVYDACGARYEAHRDNELLGPGRWVNHRALTAIAYVNPEGFEREEDGGRLRCHVGAAQGDVSGATAARVQDIPPRGGTAVLFPARSLLHEVLPSYAKRFALTLWFPAVSCEC